MRVVVIGAGVIGASVAFNLAQLGASVVLLDERSPGAGTSSTSFGWLNANGKNPESYFRLNWAGLQAHRRLSEDLRGTWIGGPGHIECAVTSDHEGHLVARMEWLRQHDYPAQRLTRNEAERYLPHVVVPSDAKVIALFGDESYCFPNLYLEDILRAAIDEGVDILVGRRVVGFTHSSMGVAVECSDGSLFKTDVVVSAVGRWTEEIAEIAGVEVPMANFERPGDATVGYLAETTPIPVELEHIVTMPRLNLRPGGGGKLLLQALDLDADADPNVVPPLDGRLATRFLRRLNEVLHENVESGIARLVVGQRSLPADGLTVAGTVDKAPWLYVVATHSGVTLAPFLGEAVAGEVFGKTEELLEDFRPTRFQDRERMLSPLVPRRPGEQ